MIAGPPVREARLVGGSADPGGTWEYGRLELFNGFFFTGFSETDAASQLGRTGVQVACRSFGFATGAQMLSGRGSGLRGDDIRRDSIDEIICSGDEYSLTDCMIDEDRYHGSSRFFGENSGDNSVAIICSNPSGIISHKPCKRSAALKFGFRRRCLRLV